MKKIIVLIVVFGVLSGCAAQHQKIVYDIESLETDTAMYMEIWKELGGLVDENAQLRKSFYVLWLGNMLREAKEAKEEDAVEEKIRSGVARIK